MANKQLGDTLRNLRLTNGYTQQQVADLLGLKNKSTLGSWEVGKSEPDGFTLLRLCKLYGVTNIYETFIDEPEGVENDYYTSVLLLFKQLNPRLQENIIQQIELFLELQNKQLK